MVTTCEDLHLKTDYQHTVNIKSFHCSSGWLENAYE